MNKNENNQIIDFLNEIKQCRIKREELFNKFFKDNLKDDDFLDD